MRTAVTAAVIALVTVLLGIIAGITMTNYGLTPEAGYNQLRLAVIGGITFGGIAATFIIILRKK